MKPSPKTNQFSNILRHGLAPAAFYSFFFCVLSYPLILDFSTRFFTDAGDGLQNVWNIWWINQAVSQPSVHPSIWQTSLLHWPFGITLLGQTLNPFNGLVAVLLLRFMTLTQAHNTLVLFAFVMGGITMYRLAYYLTRSFWASLVAGYIFTFSSFHFAHYNGHLQLVSLEWIPLFVLCWYILMTRPNALMAVASALVLWLVLFCDYYYFFYCILTGGFIVIWFMIEKKDFWFFVKREHGGPLAVFIVVALILVAPVVLPLTYVSRADPFAGAHNPLSFSLDLFALFIPGGHWRFNHLTEFYWSRLPGNTAESSLYLGLSVLVLLGYLWMNRRDVVAVSQRQTKFWFLLLGFFFVMALGPALQINGRVVYDKLMPYSILEIILPFLKLSGVPVRMVVMVNLIVSLLSAITLPMFFQRYPRRLYIVVIVLAVLFVEYLPDTLESTSNKVPAYASALADLPNDGGVLDLATPTRYLQLYYQTAYRKPLVLGYVSRLPLSLVEKESGLMRAINRRDYVKLWDIYQVRYIITKEVIEEIDPYVSIKTIYQDAGVHIYRLECTCESQK